MGDREELKDMVQGAVSTAMSKYMAWAIGIALTFFLGIFANIVMNERQRGATEERDKNFKQTLDQFITKQEKLNEEFRNAIIDNKEYTNIKNDELNEDITGQLNSIIDTQDQIIWKLVSKYNWTPKTTRRGAGKVKKDGK